MNWLDTLDIAIELAERHPEVDPKSVLFTDLKSYVMALPDFHDDPKRCNERILESIQQNWIDEV